MLNKKHEAGDKVNGLLTPGKRSTALRKLTTLIALPMPVLALLSFLLGI